MDPTDITVTITPEPNAPEGVYRFSIACPHQPPAGNVVLPRNVVAVDMGGSPVYLPIPGAEPVPDGITPTVETVVNLHLSHLAAHRADLPSCACWTRAVMRYGAEHAPPCPDHDISRH